MEQTQQAKEILPADRTSPEAEETESENIVEMLKLLYGNHLKAMRLMWCQLFFTGGLVILLFIASFFLLSKAPFLGNVAAPSQRIIEKPLSTSAITTPPQAPQTQQVPKPTAISEWEEVRDLLNRVREAQMKEDIHLFLDAYSPTFPNLVEKKKSVLKSWQRFDYLDMNFNIGNIQRLTPHTIMVTVGWDISFEDAHSKKKSTLLQDYLITLSNVSGKWLIQEVTQGKENTRGGRSGLHDRLL
jgi:hypothetical protein